jgi:hypothetical protein
VNEIYEVQEALQGVPAILLEAKKGLHEFEVDSIFESWRTVMYRVFDIKVAQTKIVRDRQGKILVDFAKTFGGLVQMKEKVTLDSGGTEERIASRGFEGTYLMAPLVEVSKWIDKLHRVLVTSTNIHAAMKGWYEPKNKGAFLIGKVFLAQYLSLAAGYFMLFQNVGSTDGVPSILVRKMVKNAAMMLRVVLHFKDLWGMGEAKEFQADTEQRFQNGEFKRLEFFLVQTAKYLASITAVIDRTTEAQ